MNILTAEHLYKSYTAERILLKDAAFSLQEGEKVGVIGVNGMGKSTLLKLLARTEEPDQGTVIMGSHVKLAYLEQTPALEDTDTGFSDIFSSAASLTGYCCARLVK